MSTITEQYAKAQARAEELAAKVAAEQAEAAQAAADRLLAHDRRVVADYDQTEQALQDEERQAREEFERELISHPVFAAWVRHRAARWRRMALAQETAGAITRAGLDQRPPFEIPYRDPRLLEDIVDLLDKAAQHLAEDERERWHGERQALAEGGA